MTSRYSSAMRNVYVTAPCTTRMSPFRILPSREWVTEIFEVMPTWVSIFLPDRKKMNGPLSGFSSILAMLPMYFITSAYLMPKTAVPPFLRMMPGTLVTVASGRWVWASASVT